jgi:Holliday junction resolvasome RuvABC endonuclease subunit
MAALPTARDQVSSIVRVAGIDPALANIGVAKMLLDLETMELDLEEIALVSTEKRTTKSVRQNSDDLRRCRELHEAVHMLIIDREFVFAEVPSGSQHARSAFGFGAATMLLSSIKQPLFEVQLDQTKLASVGSKTATKPEIIAWAAGLYPSAPWLRYTREVKNKSGDIVHRKGDLHDDNEHTADACAIVHAGINTLEFKNLLAMVAAHKRVA